jgi:hypothetical protein
VGQDPRMFLRQQGKTAAALIALDGMTIGTVPSNAVTCPAGYGVLTMTGVSQWRQRRRHRSPTGSPLSSGAGLRPQATNGKLHRTATVQHGLKPV